MCEDALTGGVAGGTENTEDTSPPHSPWAGSPEGSRNAAMGLQGLDQLLELRWKLHQPSLCILANGHQPPNPLLPSLYPRREHSPGKQWTRGRWGVEGPLTRRAEAGRAVGDSVITCLVVI